MSLPILSRFSLQSAAGSGRFSRWVLPAFLTLVAVGGSVPCLADDGAESKLRFSGDFRFRIEADWDSQRADGRARDDRTRARVRGRFSLSLAATERLSLGLRLRTGARESQQSPHITVYDFDDNPRGEAEALFDRWFLRFEDEGRWLRLGRDTYPFWKQNELFWDDDVTLPGLAVGRRRGALTLTAAWLALPDGGVDFGGTLLGAQALLSRRAGPLDLDLAFTVLALEGDSGTRFLRQGNGARDYTLWQASLRLRREWRGRPLGLGLDLTHNSEPYRRDDSDPFTAAHHDQVDGWVVSLQWGRTQQRGDWLLGYFLARIETLAVNASYSQDDWVRWGSATQTDGSDFEGHELRLAVGLGGGSNLVARLYLAEAITSPQDGRRFRVDYNLRF